MGGPGSRNALCAVTAAGRWHPRGISADDTIATRTRKPEPGGIVLPDVASEGGVSGFPNSIDRYRIVRRIGSGGMGSVFEAVDPSLDRHVAIKLLHGDADPESIEAKRLLREARALAQLDHPNIVEVYGAGMDAGRVWLAMELVDGQTLKEWMLANPPGSAAQCNEALALLKQAADGLEAAHTVSMTHRDCQFTRHPRAQGRIASSSLFPPVWLWICQTPSRRRSRKAHRERLFSAGSPSIGM
ncbi:MAG: serine/threonine-protein kinase [Nannocystales bacterium]